MRPTAAIAAAPPAPRLALLAACRRIARWGSARAGQAALRVRRGGARRAAFAEAATPDLCPLELATVQPSLLDAVRQPLEAALGRTIGLRVLRLGVEAGWALVAVEPTDIDGAPLPPWGGRRTARVCALVRAEGDGWRAMAYALDGCAAAWAQWPARGAIARARYLMAHRHAA
jgi:hypothetical protein